MAASLSFNNPHLGGTSKSSFTKLIFSKSIIFVFVLVVLPIFPSQAPEFITQTPLTKVWELLYLLIIGIAVCYGLFSRKTIVNNINTEACSSFVTTKTQIWSPLNGVLQISSMFEDGFESSCGLDELKIPPIWSPLSNGVYSNGYSVLDDHRNSGFSVSENGVGNFNVSDGKKVSQDFTRKHVFDQLGKQKSEIEYKPLGLPIRSLRSKNVDSCGSELNSNVKSGCSLNFKGCSNAGDNVDSGRVRGLVPTNLEGKFKEAVAVPSPIPWSSRSARMETRDKTGAVESCSDIKSQSFRCSTPSQPDYKDTSSKLSSFASIPPKLPDSKMEDLKGKEKSDGSRPSFLQSIRNSSARHFSIGSISEMNVQISSNDGLKDFKSKKGSLEDLIQKENSDGSKPSFLQSIRSSGARHFSIGSTSEMNADSIRKPDVIVNAKTSGRFPNTKMEESKGTEKRNAQPSFTSSNVDAPYKNSNTRSLSMGSSLSMEKVNGIENYLKEFLETKEDDAFGAGRPATDNLKSSQKPSALVNSYTPGKSVRRIRSSDKCGDSKETGKAFPSSIDDRCGVKLAEGVELENMPMHTRKGIFDTIKESKFENFDVRPDDKGAGLDMFSDAEPHSGEVDRRADEFIAKFREQIRLQKVASHLNFW